eukprot:3987340-Pyramimonas_sp.AAC.1
MPAPKLMCNTRQPPRIIRLGLHHSGIVLFATFGLPAGCSFANVAVRACTITGYDQFVHRNPSVDFMSYTDDAGVQASGRDRDLASGVAVQAGVQFQAVSRRLQATLNHKVAVAASDSALGLDVSPRSDWPRRNLNQRWHTSVLISTMAVDAHMHAQLQRGTLAHGSLHSA